MIKKHFFFIQKGLGTNEKKMIEILCSKDAQEIKVLKAAYKKGKNL